MQVTQAPPLPALDDEQRRIAVANLRDESSAPMAISGAGDSQAPGGTAQPIRYEPAPLRWDGNNSVDVAGWLTEQGLPSDAHHLLEDAALEKIESATFLPDHPLTRHHAVLELAVIVRIRELGGEAEADVGDGDLDELLAPNPSVAALVVRFAKAFDRPGLLFHGRSVEAWQGEIDDHNDVLRRRKTVQRAPVDAARVLGLQNIFARVHATQQAIKDRALEVAQSRWCQGTTVPFSQLVEDALVDQLQQHSGPLRVALLKAHPGLSNELGLIVQDGCTFPAFRTWVSEQLPDLAYGETILPPRVPTGLLVEPPKAALIARLAKVGEVGDSSDLHLLKQALTCIDSSLLNELAGAGYTVVIARDNVTHGQKSLSGRKSGSGFVTDHADGVHSVEEGKRTITVRSFMQDGKLAFNVSTLMHEIGHAVDTVLRASAKKPLHEKPLFAEAFVQEHKNFSRTYFHDQREFMAEFFALYSMDREQAQRKFPLSSKAFDTLDFGELLVDGKALVELHRQMVAEAPVTASPSPVEILEEHQRLNDARSAQQKTLEPLVIELDGEPAATESLAKQLGSHWVTLRAPTVGPFGLNDGLVRLSAAAFNDPTQLNELLSDVMGTRGAVLYVEDASAIPSTSPGFQVLRTFQERTGDLCPVIVAGSRSDREHFRGELGAVLSKEIVIDPLGPEQIAELVRREASNDGYELSAEAADALLSRTRGGDHRSAMELWRSIKQSQQDRKVVISDEIAKQTRTIGWVLRRDVDAARVTSRPDAMAELEKLIGLGAVKTELRRLIAAQKVNEQRERLALPVQERRRLNLLFSGNPGTGKTTVAELLSQLALENGLVKRSGVEILSAGELAKNGPQALYDAFRRAKDGMLFIDEFHQLADPNTSGGKGILNALVPLLTDPEYADTIFIGAGYPDRLRELMDVDQGLRRRFTDIPFEDYTTDELGLIIDKCLDDRRFIASDEVKQAVLQRVVSMQRAAKYPGNAGDVTKVMGEVADRQQARLGEAPDISALTALEMQTIELSDVIVPPKHTVDEVMAEIMALEGLDDAKSMLWGLVGTVEINLEQGRDPLTDVEPYFILDGPAGSGKTTLARLIGKLFSALDIIPSDEIVETTGGKMVGGYVGNSSALAVQGACEKAWGRTLFVDEIVGMATSGDFSVQSAKELLTQTLNHKGKFVMVVADYPNNIDRFLALDQGIARRFANRLHLEPMSAEGGARLFRKLLDQRGLDRSDVDGIIDARMPELASLAAWASGGDVGTLDGKLWRLQVAAKQKARQYGQSFDLKKLSPDVVNEAFDELARDIQMRPDPNRLAHATAQAFNYATQTQETSAVQVKSETAAVDPLTTGDHSLLATLGEVDQEFGTRFNDPDELERQESDPNSDYNRALAAKLGVRPEKAKEAREAVRIKVKRMVEVMEPKQVQKFEYHCPYCGRINSASCAYIKYPFEWKLEKSLKKPWTETAYETKKVEQVVDEVLGSPGPVGPQAGHFELWN